MKKTGLFFLLMLLMVLPAAAQLGIDLGLGSQSAKIRSTSSYLQYFSISSSVRYQASAVFVKFGTRQGMARNTSMRAYEIEEDLYGNKYYGQITEIETKFRESGVGFGVGFTFTSTDKITRPYLMFEYYSMKKTFDFDNPSQPIVLMDRLGQYDPVMNDLTAVNGKNIVQTTGHFRFSAGFQFELKNGFALFNEASINLNNNEQFYTINFSIDLGLRYFFLGLK